MITSKYSDLAEGTKTLQHQGNGTRKRILVVEANPIGLMLLSQLLKAHGYDILQTPEGWEAIDLVRDKQPDLILMGSSGTTGSTWPWRGCVASNT
jgi:response regulator RpfG family c-di-GMP phosphodiesterase